MERMIATLTHIFGVHNLAVGEDVTQDAFCPPWKSGSSVVRRKTLRRGSWAQPRIVRSMPSSASVPPALPS
jgi:hypothetical protein